MKVFGIALIVLGAIMLIYSGFTYAQREKVLDAGPVHISADKEKSVNWPPYVGGILNAGGVVVLAMRTRRIA